jgi:hypothetical protein
MFRILSTILCGISPFNHRKIHHANKPNPAAWQPCFLGFHGRARSAPEPSGEINNGIDKTPISDVSVIGWDAAGRAPDSTTRS